MTAPFVVNWPGHARHDLDEFRAYPVEHCVQAELDPLVHVTAPAAQPVTDLHAAHVPVPVT